MRPADCLHCRHFYPSIQRNHAVISCDAWRQQISTGLKHGAVRCWIVSFCLAFRRCPAVSRSSRTRWHGAACKNLTRKEEVPAVAPSTDHQSPCHQGGIHSPGRPHAHPQRCQAPELRCGRCCRACPDGARAWSAIDKSASTLQDLSAIVLG